MKGALLYSCTVLRCIPAPTSTATLLPSVIIQITRAACSLKGTAMKQSCEVKTKRASLAGPFAIHFEARLKPLGWSSSIDLCAAGEKNPAFGVLAAIYASDNQVSLPQFRRFELAVLPLESPAMKAQTSPIGHLIQSHLRRWKERTELSPQSAL